MSDQATLLLNVELAHPNDPVPLLVAADWFEEHDEEAMGYALRWSAAHGKRPHKRIDVVKTPWQWIRQQVRYAGQLSGRKVANRRHAVLPQPLFDSFAKGPWHYSAIHFTHIAGAYRQLSSGLRILRTIVEMPDIVLPPAPVVIRTGPVMCAACGIMRDRDRPACPVCASTTTREP